MDHPNAEGKLMGVCVMAPGTLRHLVWMKRDPEYWL